MMLIQQTHWWIKHETHEDVTDDDDDDHDHDDADDDDGEGLFNDIVI